MDKNTILGRNDKHILLYKPATLQSHIFKFQSSSHPVKKISFNNNLLYVLSTSGYLQIYHIPG